MKNQKKNIFLLLGGPAFGKGSLARILIEMGYPSISTGDLLREKAKTNAWLRDIMNSGGLVSDDYVFDLLSERVAQPDCANGFVLDGYPRTLEQAKKLIQVFGQENIRAIELDVSDKTVFARIGFRKTCEGCGKIYGAALEGNICPECGNALMVRSDDNAETLQKRLEVYRANQPAISAYLISQGYACPVINGEQKPEYICAKALELLGLMAA